MHHPLKVLGKAYFHFRWNGVKVCVLGSLLKWFLSVSSLFVSWLPDGFCSLKEIQNLPWGQALII